MPHAPQSSLDEIRVSDKLPSPNGVALEILRLTGDENTSTTQLSNVLATDPALSAQILKYANSALVRTGQPARSVNEAVVRLGLDTVRQLALGFSLLSQVRSGPCEAFDYSGFWTRSLAGAVCAQALSRLLPGVTPDEAFTCGLLGRIGRLCLASVHPGPYSQVLHRWQEGSVERLLQLEQEAFSIDHNAIAVALFDDWRLPASYQEAVRHQDDPAGIQDLPRPRQTLPRLLYLAHQLAEICAAQPQQRGHLMEELLRRSTALGLSDDSLAAGCEQALKAWQHMGRVLGIRVAEVPPIQELVARASRDSRSRTEPDPVAEPRPLASSDLNAVCAEGLRILVVDDNPLDRRLVSSMLQGGRHTITLAEGGQEALLLALQTNPQVVLTDWMMPQLSGLELCASLRRSAELAHTYVIVMTAQVQNEKMVEAFDAGADDYLVKPVNRQILGARLLAAQRLIGLRERVEHDREQIRHFAAQQAVLNRKLRQMALYDELTGIGNRRCAMDHLQREWSDAERHDQQLICMLIDIDHFKQVNDTYGHDAGDLVLKETARVMQACLRTSDVVCRFGGEEFIAICPNADLATAGQLGNRLRAAVEQNAIKDPRFTGQITVSIGVAGYTPQVASITELLKLADKALYAAKAAGRNKVCVMDMQPA